MNKPAEQQGLPDWPEQKLRGHKIDGFRYTSKEFFDTEFEHMWTKVWLLLGRESEIPEPGDWQREAPADYQQEILDAEHPPFTESPNGNGTIETYTVLHGRNGVERALVIGRLDDGTRFIAETPDDEQTLRQMMDGEMIGASGIATAGDEKNLFVPNFG